MEDLNTHISISRIKYHRNGVCGAGFYSVEFSFTDRDYRDPMRMVATIFPPETEKWPTHYSVLSLDDPSECWRGDHFVDPLWAAVEAHRAETHASCYA